MPKPPLLLAENPRCGNAIVLEVKAGRVDKKYLILTKHIFDQIGQFQPLHFCQLSNQFAWWSLWMGLLCVNPRPQVFIRNPDLS